MSVSQDLLFKVAKVYEAAESVEGMKPKMQQEEHKKMTPDEFSRENSKSAASWPKAIEDANQWLQNATRSGYGGRTANYHNLALFGAGLGGLSGALTAPKGKMLKRTLQGAGLGGVAGLGAGLGGQLGFNLTDGRKHIVGDPHLDSFYRGAIPFAGAMGGGLLAHTLADKALNEVTDDTESGDYNKKRKEDKDLAEMREGLAKISSAPAAYAFGVKLAKLMAQ